ncbi:MAG: manganese efflux pump [Eubacterium sp.]|nr:manganese efflux pump [Eubacterium sp.]
MDIYVIIMIAIGLSFDVFAVAIVEGAMIAKIEKTKLVVLCAIFSLWQMMALVCGDLLSQLPDMYYKAQGLSRLWTIISTILFFCLSALMFYKAVHGKPVFETVKEINYKSVFFAAIFVSIDAFVAGIAMGFLGAELILESIVLEIITVVFVIGGLYTGYRLGAEQKPRVLFLGALFLLAASIDVVVRFYIVA